MNARKRLQRLNSQWGKTKPRRGGMFDLPQGTFEMAISKAKFVEKSKAPFAKDQLEVQLRMKVLTGGCKGKMGQLNIFLEQPPRELNGNTIPGGLETLMTITEDLGIKLPELSEKRIKKALAEMIGQKGKFYSTGKMGTCYWNGPLDVADVEIDDDEFDEDEEDEESEVEVEDEEESEEEDEDDDKDDEEEEEPPKKSKSKSEKKSKSKDKSSKKDKAKDKAKSKSKEEPQPESEDDDEWGDEFDEEFDD